jgi:hypothetical protein
MIVAHNDDSKEFEKLVFNSVSALKQDAENKNEYYLGRGGTYLEKDVYDFVKENSKGTIFKGNIELISGQKFPDIVAYVDSNKANGIEVKTTKSNTWKSTGSSIFEGTRVQNVENIYLLFAKLTNPVEFKYKKYEDCLYNVAITHSPRYLIDMEIDTNETIFSKIGVEYNDLRCLKNPFDPIKKYLRKDLKKGEDVWWIENNINSNLNVRLWGGLQQDEKEEITLMALAHFPSLFGKNSKKYAPLATWLVSRFGIVNYALRDTFTAGGVINIDGVVGFPQIFKYLKNERSLDKIYQNIGNISQNDIDYYWGEFSSNSDSSILKWKKICLLFCKDNNFSQNKIKIIKNLLQL